MSHRLVSQLKPSDLLARAAIPRPEYAAAARIAFGFTGAESAVSAASNHTISHFFIRAFTLPFARHNSSAGAGEIHSAGIPFSVIIGSCAF